MTNINRELLKGTAGADLAYGDIVKYHTDGTFIKQDSAEATDSIGIVWAAGNDGDLVTVLVRGVIDDLHFLIEDTSGSSGYDSAITHGDLLLVSGKTAGTYGVGQAVSKIDGTGVTTANATTIVARALEANAGSASGDTYGKIKAYVSFC